MTEDEILEHLLLFVGLLLVDSERIRDQPAPLSSFPARFPEMPGS
jgi:hypothetical protein